MSLKLAITDTTKQTNHQQQHQSTLSKQRHPFLLIIPLPPLATTDQTKDYYCVLLSTWQEMTNGYQPKKPAIPTAVERPHCMKKLEAPTPQVKSAFVFNYVESSMMVCKHQNILASLTTQYPMVSKTTILPWLEVTTNDNNKNMIHNN
eukprot:12040243-Ditylum_brightwellii.AAC.1